MKTADIKRKNGYYKVFHNNEWRIAYWYIEGQCWFLVGVEKTFNDSEMDIIIETPITFEQTQPVSIGEEVIKQTSIAWDESKRYEDYKRGDIIISKDEAIPMNKEEYLQSLQPVPSKEVEGEDDEPQFQYVCVSCGGSRSDYPPNFCSECQSEEFEKVPNPDFKLSTPSIKEEKVSTGLDQLIEWMEWESHRRWNESHELPDFTEILTKANEIKEQLNK